MLAKRGNKLWITNKQANRSSPWPTAARGGPTLLPIMFKNSSSLFRFFVQLSAEFGAFFLGMGALSTGAEMEALSTGAGAFFNFSSFLLPPVKRLGSTEKP